MSLITVTTSGLLSLHISKIRNSAHRHVSINAARREKAAKKLPVTSILDVKHLSVDSYRFFLIFKKHIISFQKWCTFCLSTTLKKNSKQQWIRMLEMAQISPAPPCNNLRRSILWQLFLPEIICQSRRG